MTKTKITNVIVLTLILIAASGCGESENSVDTKASARCTHEIKGDMCPFCNPAMIESDGFCGEHGVAEALCYKCRPYLNAAFRAKGDWCDQHKAPDSQCMVCHPELKEKINPGAGHGVSMEESS